MPIREYRCTNGRCENVQGFEYLHIKSGEGELVSCPKCGFDLENLISICSAHFKGSGFFSTDYGTHNKSKKVEVEGKTETISDPKEIRRLKKETKRGEPKKQT